MFSQIIKNSHSLQEIFPYIRLRPMEIAHQDIHVVGLGSAGTHVAEYFFSQSPEFTYTSISCPPKKFIQHLNVLFNKSAGSNNMDNLYGALDQDLSISELLGCHNHYVLIAGIGGNLGRELLELCIEYLEEINASYEVIAITPFSFEGKPALSNAQAFISGYDDNDKIKYFHNDELLISCGQNLMADSFNYANAKMFELFQSQCVH